MEENTAQPTVNTKVVPSAHLLPSFFVFPLSIHLLPNFFPPLTQYSSFLFSNHQSFAFVFSITFARSLAEVVLSLLSKGFIQSLACILPLSIISFKEQSSSSWSASLAIIPSFVDLPSVS